MVVAERYGLEGILGEGGMGRAWRAYDQHLNKIVVIKTVVTPDEQLRIALAKEAATLTNLRHPNIVSIIDFFTVDTELCYVMEFISGPSWADEIEEPGTRKLVLPMSAEDALKKVKALLPAFKYLHGLKPPIIYCDFKPSNVKTMTLPTGEVAEILLDFGTAYSYDPQRPPKPARGTPGYHSPQALHPDWRDDYFTIGRALAEMVGMEEVHTEDFKYTLTDESQFPWTQYDDSFRYFVEWLTAKDRNDRPDNVDEIMLELDGVLGYVKGQKPDVKAARAHHKAITFKGVTKETMAMTGTGTIKIDLPPVPATNPAATVLLRAQELYEQGNFSRALILANQAVNNQGGSDALILRSMVHNRLGDLEAAQTDIKQAQATPDSHTQWQMLLSEGQLLESKGQYELAAERYRRIMSLRPGDHRGRLLLADLYRRSGNPVAAIDQYKAIIQSKPNIGPAYLGASKAYLATDQLDSAIKVLEDVSSRNASYNEVLSELVGLYTQRALQGSPTALESAARAIDTLHQNGLENAHYYELVAEFYYSALTIAYRNNTLPSLSWPLGKQISTVQALALENERAWRTYLDRAPNAERGKVINTRIMAMRSWAVM
jgi:tetratricopeptide (TPR) repeat protein